MTDWVRTLRIDPDVAMSRERADAIRRAVVAAADAAPRPAFASRLKLASAAALLALAGGAIVERPGTEPVAPEAATIEPPSVRRQLQFSTPGGTRIIWELNPEFRLTETLP